MLSPYLARLKTQMLLTLSASGLLHNSSGSFVVFSRILQQAHHTVSVCDVVVIGLFSEEIPIIFCTGA
jgi:hypothetical protein